MHNISLLVNMRCRKTLLIYVFVSESEITFGRAHSFPFGHPCPYRWCLIRCLPMKDGNGKGKTLYWKTLKTYLISVRKHIDLSHRARSFFEWGRNFKSKKGTKRRNKGVFASDCCRVSKNKDVWVLQWLSTAGSEIMTSTSGLGSKPAQTHPNNNNTLTYSLITQLLSSVMGTCWNTSFMIVALLQKVDC